MCANPSVHGANIIEKGIRDLMMVYLQMLWLFYSIISVTMLNFISINFFNHD